MRTSEIRAARRIHSLTPDTSMHTLQRATHIPNMPLRAPAVIKAEAYNEYIEEENKIKFIRPRSVIDINLSLINTR